MCTPVLHQLLLLICRGQRLVVEALPVNQLSLCKHFLRGTVPASLYLHIGAHGSVERRSGFQDVYT